MKIIQARRRFTLSEFFFTVFEVYLCTYERAPFAQR